MTQEECLEAINNAWGTGFELIYINKNKQCFEKIDEITYIIWDGTYVAMKNRFDGMKVTIEDKSILKDFWGFQGDKKIIKSL
ncbi:MAG: hypothetical protein BWY74_02945 [Firmicutes bacterium ADurb.Bin419]|nr:MAG: hypothetical protein BWY74_02945 [Firmicutes bacterium ADurb.Bin419]